MFEMLTFDNDIDTNMNDGCSDLIVAAARNETQG